MTEIEWREDDMLQVKGNHIYDFPYAGVELHHTVTPYDQDLGEACRDIYSYDRSKGMSDIWYHFLIDKNGNQAAGRTINRACVGSDGTVIPFITIAFVGNYNIDPVTDEEIYTAQTLINGLRTAGFCGNEITYHGAHRPSQCPGTNIIDALNDFHPYDNNPGPRPDTRIDKFPVIKMGSRGNYVKALQERLNHVSNDGHREYRLVVDGIFGDRTNWAVRNYQSSHGLVVDGIVGPLTWASLALR